jgi:CPA1 family monovalent cation:H+ antiporter
VSIFNVVAVFITLVALAAWVNYRYIKLPSTIGLMLIGLALSLGLIGLSAIGVDIRTPAEKLLGSINFGETLMRGMLSFLLFAGALRINFQDLKQEKFSITSLATVGVAASTFLVGTALYYALKVVEMPLAYGYCLVFGALISPTDPVAVLAILRTVHAPKNLATRIAGESLFNDGVGVVVFTVLLGIVTHGGSVEAGHVILLFAREALGAIVFGLVIGYFAFILLREVDNYTVEILLTLALVSGGYALASELGVSGPIAIVVAGLLIGNHGRWHAMSEETRVNLDMFWELIDEFLNAVLFVWIGLEILIVPFTWTHLIVGLIAIPVALGSRFISVFGVINVLRFKREFTRHAVKVLTWGGLRGGLAIAMALSITRSDARDLIVAITYVVVVFSILVQGLTIKRVVKDLVPDQGAAVGHEESTDIQ